MREIKVPSYLHKIHGKYNTLPEIVAPHLIAVLASTLAILLMQSFNLLEVLLIVIITYDLSGGAIANFTSGTSKYYAASKRLRWVFLATHISQPLVLAYVFPASSIIILSVSAFLLLMGIIVNELKDSRNQVWVAITGSSLAILIMIGYLPYQGLFSVMHPVLLMNLIFMTIKLPLAFAVRWSEFPSKAAKLKSSSRIKTSAFLAEEKIED